MIKYFLQVEKVCNPQTDTCVECLVDTDCNMGTGNTRRLCKLETNTCVECKDDLHCLDTAIGKCNLDTNTCIQCYDSDHCNNLGENYRCDLSTKICVQCLTDRDCGVGSSSVLEARCYTPTSTCVMCLIDDDCSGNPIGIRCKPETHQCAECLQDSHCPLDRPSCDRFTNRCYAGKYIIQYSTVQVHYIIEHIICKLYCAINLHGFLVSVRV